jgi:hypothetical protein
VTRLPATGSVLIVCLCLSFGNAFAQSVEKSVENEPAAIVELGGAASQSLTGDGASFGPTVAVEVTPIENRLELEAGVTALLKQHSAEWSVDLLFKKPWTLSKKAEFMVGIGPEWIHARRYGITTNSAGAKPWRTSCTGPHPQNTNSVGMLNRALNITLGEGMSSLLA